MKYRIRNIKTGEISRDARLYMCQNGLIRRTGYKGSYLYLKAEMEVADGVYEGDCLLLYTHVDSGIYYPYVYEVVIVDGVPSVIEMFNDDEDFYAGEPESLNDLYGDYEVIKCR